MTDESAPEPDHLPQGRTVRAIRAGRTLLGRLRSIRLGLRLRILLMFASGSLLLAAFLAAVAYGFTRSSVVTQRDRAGVEQANRNAQIAQNELNTSTPSPEAAVARLRSLGVASFAINYRGTWTASSARSSPESIPVSLQARVVDDGVPARLITRVDGEPLLVIGIPLTVTTAAYFEFVPLDDASNTLDSVRLSLLFAAFITTLAGALLGVVIASRAVRPLGEAAQAAKREARKARRAAEKAKKK